MPLDRHLTPDFQQNTQVPRTVNTHTELTGGPAYPDCKPPPGRSVTDSQPLPALSGCAGNTTARSRADVGALKMCDFVQSVPQRPVGPESDAGAEARSGESAATKASHFGADAGAPKGGACARPARREDCFHTHPKAPPVQTRTARPRARTRRTPPMVRCGFALRACGRMDF